MHHIESDSSIKDLHYKIFYQTTKRSMALYAWFFIYCPQMQPIILNISNLNNIHPASTGRPKFGMRAHPYYTARQAYKNIYGTTFISHPLYRQQYNYLIQTLMLLCAVVSLFSRLSMNSCILSNARWKYALFLSLRVRYKWDWKILRVDKIFRKPHTSHL